MERVTHYAERKPDLLSRSRKAEGQVRGLQQMIESDRYCLDVAHQVEAAVAALREVSGIALESHLHAWAQDAAQGKSTPGPQGDRRPPAAGGCDEEDGPDAGERITNASRRRHPMFGLADAPLTQGRIGSPK